MGQSSAARRPVSPVERGPRRRSPWILVLLLAALSWVAVAWGWAMLDAWLA